MDNVTPAAAKPRRTKPKGRHPHNALAAAFIRTAPVGRHADGNGLYLYVQRTGNRSWIQRLVIRGRKHELGLRQRPSHLPRRGPGAGPRQPQARPRGRRPPRRQAPYSRHAHPRRGRRHRGRAEAGRLAQPQAGGRLDAQPGTPRLPGHRLTARLRGQQRRRAGGPHENASCQTAGRSATSATSSASAAFVRLPSVITRSTCRF